MTIEQRVKNLETACYTLFKLIEEMTEIMSRLNTEVLKELQKEDKNNG